MPVATRTLAIFLGSFKRPERNGHSGAGRQSEPASTVEGTALKSTERARRCAVTDDADVQAVGRNFGFLQLAAAPLGLLVAALPPTLMAIVAFRLL